MGSVPDFSHAIQCTFTVCARCWGQHKDRQTVPTDINQAIPSMGGRQEGGKAGGLLRVGCRVTLYPPPLASGQYFQGRLAEANSTAGTLGTNHTGPADTFNFNNWVTLLSQLPLLIFTLLNSFLYQW